MKKNYVWITVITATVFYCNALTAQNFNNTFPDGNGTMVDIADASSGGRGFSCVLGTSAKSPIILKKFDFGGNLVFDVSAVSVTPGISIKPTEVLHTPSDEYIVVGMYDDGVTMNPFAARFNSMGIFIWMQVYHSNPVGRGAGYYEKVNICRVEDDGPLESFIIVATTQDPNILVGGGSGLDLFTNAIRINASGTIIWSKKYVPNTGSIISPNFDARDYPKSIAFINDNNPRYFIGGGCEIWSTSGISYRGFFMSIDKAGAIADPYTIMPSSLHWFEEAIYDNNTGQIVTAYTSGNAGTGVTVSPSVIGVTRYTTAGGLVHTGSDFYGVNPANETYGVGIKEDVTHSYYLVAASTYPQPMSDPTLSTLALLKLNKSSLGTPVFFNNYNTQRVSAGVGIVDLVDGPFEEYAVAANIPSYNAGGDAMRVVATDPTGVACGVSALPYAHGNPTYSTVPFISTTYPCYAQHSETLISAIFTQTTTYCMPGPGASSYKTSPTSVNDPGEIDPVRLYPTLLLAEKEVSLDVNAENASSINVVITSLDGKVVSKQALNLLNGANHLKIEMPEFTSGTYMLKATSVDGAINKTFKITRL